MRVARRDGPQVTAAAATLLVAAACWIVLVVQAGQMNATSAMAAPAPFMATWVVMMAAMMLPGAVPFLSGIAALSREDWPLGTAVAAVSYLAVWAALGIVAYVIVQVLPPAWMGERVIAGAAVAGAGFYAFTPLQRRFQARCRAMCDTPRSTTVSGLRYGLSCAGCSGGVMVALLLLGSSSVAWMAVASLAVLLYKVAPLRPLWQNAQALALIALGIGVAIISA